ncbi:MAG: serpin family protein [Bacteroidota bacterium]
MNKTSKLLFLILFAFGVLSCEELDQLGTIPPNENPADPVTPDWSKINPQFGFTGLQQLAEESPGSNIILSPLSIELALSMTANGTTGETYEGMKETLFQKGVLQEVVNSHFLSLTNDYNAREKVELNLANSIWIREGFPVKSAFLETNESYYQATVRELDFGAADALDQINGWVSEKTQDKIPTILDEIPADAVMYLINAIYFQGNWLSPFDTFRTQTLPFTLEAGSSEDREFMIQEERLVYLEGSDFLAVSLPFKDSTIGMSLFLPTQGLPLSTWAQSVTVDQWQEWNEKLAYPTPENRPPLVKLSLPKFELTYEKKLNDLLKDMGMEAAFSAGIADFSPMTDIQVYIDEVKHKTYLKVDEYGAEAAAVTSVGIVETSLPIIEKEILLDRPFMVVLHDYERGNILFVGLVYDPESPSK